MMISNGFCTNGILFLKAWDGNSLNLFDEIGFYIVKALTEESKQKFLFVANDSYTSFRSIYTLFPCLNESLSLDDFLLSKKTLNQVVQNVDSTNLSVILRNGENKANKEENSAKNPWFNQTYFDCLKRDLAIISSDYQNIIIEEEVVEDFPLKDFSFTSDNNFKTVLILSPKKNSIIKALNVLSNLNTSTKFGIIVLTEIKDKKDEKSDDGIAYHTYNTLCRTLNSMGRLNLYNSPIFLGEVCGNNLSNIDDVARKMLENFFSHLIFPLAL